MFSLLIPFHSDYNRLKPILSKISKESSAHQIEEVLLCHNGPRLEPKIEELVMSWAPANARLLHTDAQGLGAGYRLGVENAKASHIIFSHSDLPFGWSDVDNYLNSSRPAMALGSKAHPESKAKDRPWLRNFATAFFRESRNFIMGSSTPGDSQGTLIIERNLAQKLIQECYYENYLISLELVTVHLAHGGSYIEVPVILEDEVGPSNVRVFRDGAKMFMGLFELCFRFRILPLFKKIKQH